ncbi:MAG: zf-HC2 domain-containing protein, partial [Candidatus Limnocylindria bacterium]|nr:zf-HC2 domain-containing protein [Candidatus Limnocylindria bacterium]
MTMHPDADLSAYLDRALEATGRAAVEAHLDTCALCRARLADLGAVSRLVAALPTPAPRRSLVPRLVARPVWLAPARTFATLASGVFGFLFLVSAVLATDPTLGGGGPGILTTSTQRAAQQR